jgi:hypothetical protein
MAAKPRSCPVIQASRGAWRPRVLSQIPATGASSWASLPFPLPCLRPQRPLFLFRYRARAVTCWNYWQGAGRADGAGQGSSCRGGAGAGSGGGRRRDEGLYGDLRLGRGRASAGPGRPVPALRRRAGPAAVEDDSKAVRGARNADGTQVRLLAALVGPDAAASVIAAQAAVREDERGAGGCGGPRPA